MSAHRCEECWAALDPAKVLRCTKCKACRYCSRECQTRNWRLHKRVCSTDPLLRRYVPVEMAVERILAGTRKIHPSKDARCYICLEGDRKSSKLMRGCACRGDSAGFVHVECLTKLAVSKEASCADETVLDGWNKCGNCKQPFIGALQLEIQRRFWRRYRSSEEDYQRYFAAKCMVETLGMNREFDAANQLLDEASTCVGNDMDMLLDLKLCRAIILTDNGQKLEALDLLQAMLPEAKADSEDPESYSCTMHQIADLLLDLDRNQEAHEATAEVVAYDKAHYGPEDPRTLKAMRTYAAACAKTGRMEEAKALFEDVLSTETRILGRDHGETRETRQSMRAYGFAVPSSTPKKR